MNNNRQTTFRWPYLYHLLLVLLHLTILSAASTSQQQQQKQQQQTTIIIVTVTATTAPTPTIPHPPSYTSPDVFENTILNVTNTYRQAHNASNLVWNKTLSEYAKKWAAGCRWMHSHGPYGENLAFGYPNVTAAVAAWGDEGLKYNFREPTGFTEETGHFTQLVWRATMEVGCAAVDCGYHENNNDNVNEGKGSAAGSGTNNKQDGESANGNGNGNSVQRPQGWYVVCEYAPPGNVVGGNDKLGDKAFFRINVQATSTYAGPWQTGDGNGNGNGGSKTSVASSTSGAAGGGFWMSWDCGWSLMLLLLFGGWWLSMIVEYC
ncbi:putative extracellular SCP domain protein Pry1 [Aspergillus saccharolyticus JOP 1030-1]|uniref:PR-1-like protein n=1 Tax=Aspergillus saccharolyticus JOP 1030-1 TaxID=1450539 RepID=A0A319AV30_9EURO|nr:PR-1-like protein [Aspergillus saccharolyticus JOP 1030-1]PYH49922.1 PR-1-like protein [Aspergillus saccharolyticus JOP 1030-1]